MRKIDKGAEPARLSLFKRQNKDSTYKDLTSVERQAIRTACLAEQYGLCAYCCKAIDFDKSMNEHVEEQRNFPNRTLDFTNIVASCTTPRQCDASHKAQTLPLTPLMRECEVELKFSLSGRVEGLTERAQQSINILNIGNSNKNLKEQRKKLVHALIFQVCATSGELEVMDEDLLKILLEEISLPTNGKLEPFSPVLVNIVRGFLDSNSL